MLQFGDSVLIVKNEDSFTDTVINAVKKIDAECIAGDILNKMNGVSAGFRKLLMTEITNCTLRD